jgi:hypothetical protein
MNRCSTLSTVGFFIVIVDHKSVKMQHFLLIFYIKQPITISGDFKIRRYEKPKLTDDGASL